MSDEDFKVVYDALELVCGAPFENEDVERILKAERAAWKVMKRVGSEVRLTDATDADLAGLPGSSGA